MVGAKRRSLLGHGTDYSTWLAGPAKFGNSPDARYTHTIFGVASISGLFICVETSG